MVKVKTLLIFAWLARAQSLSGHVTSPSPLPYRRAARNFFYSSGLSDLPRVKFVYPKDLSLNSSSQET
jgi:hypothetical protein